MTRKLRDVLVREFGKPASARRAGEAGVAPVVIGLVVAAVGTGIITGAIWGPIQAAAEAMAAVADGAIAKLPDAGDLELDAGNGWLLGYAWLNTFLPMSEALAAVGVLLAAIGAYLAFRVGLIIYHLIPKPGMGT